MSVARMAVLLLKETQHVLAAATQPPDGDPPKPEALAGSSFPLRLRMANDTRPPALFLVPAAALEAKLLPLDPRVLAQPLAFAVNGGGTAGLLPTAPLPTKVTLGELTVTAMVAAVSDERKALVAVRGLDPAYPEQRIQSGSFEAGKSDVTLGLKISLDGPQAGLEKNQVCAVMVAVAGLRLACFGTIVS
jgi:hypothetical protein